MNLLRPPKKIESRTSNLVHSKPKRDIWARAFWIIHCSYKTSVLQCSRTHENANNSQQTIFFDTMFYQKLSDIWLDSKVDLHNFVFTRFTDRHSWKKTASQIFSSSLNSHSIRLGIMTSTMKKNQHKKEKEKKEENQNQLHCTKYLFEYCKIVFMITCTFTYDATSYTLWCPMDFILLPWIVI